MKWYPNQFKQNLTNLPPLLLVYGEDGGLVSELAQKASEASGVVLDDPFASTRMDAAELAKEPSRLLEVATTITFMGGKQLIRVDGCNSGLTTTELAGVTEAVKACLSESLQDVQIIVPAAGLEAKSALAKAVESSKSAAAVRCYHDTSRDLGTVIREFFRDKNKTIAPDAVAFLVENLGNDRAITKYELEKLDLYTAEQANVGLEECLAVIANAPSVGVFKLCDAIGSRDRAGVDKLVQALMAEGEDMHFITMMVHRHLKRLWACQRSMDGGNSLEGAMKSLKPPVLFGKDDFARQVRMYPKKRLEGLAERLVTFQHESRLGTVPPSLAAARLLLGLAA